MFALGIPVSPSWGFATTGSVVGVRTLWANWMDHLARQATLLVMKLLIIAGAYVVGSFLGTLLAVALNRWVFRKKMPEVGKQLCSMVGGLLLALLAALFVMGSGGSGLFGGGGEGTGENPTPTEGSSTDSAPPQEAVGIPPRPQVSPPPQREVSTVIRVTVLAGKAVREMGRFYLLEDDPTPRTFTEITDAILQRRPKTGERLTVWILFPADPNLAPPTNDPKVARLVDWVRQEAGLDVTFPTRRR